MKYTDSCKKTDFNGSIMLVVIVRNRQNVQCSEQSPRDWLLHVASTFGNTATTTSNALNAISSGYPFYQQLPACLILENNSTERSMRNNTYGIMQIVDKKDIN